MARRGGTRARIDVSEIEDFAAKLQRAAADIERSARRLEKEYAEKLADLARAKAPRSMGRQSPMSQRYGPLHSQITARSIGTREGQRAAVTIGNAFYGVFHEYGTVKMRRRPFVRPAIRKLRPQFRDAVIAEAMRLLGH